MFSLLFALALAAAEPDYRHVGATPPPHGLPKIVGYTISKTLIHAGETIHGTVETSANVDYVEARIDYRNAPLERIAPGRYKLDYKVPWWLPPWLRHAYTLEVIARTADGVEEWVGIPIRIV